MSTSVNMALLEIGRGIVCEEAASLDERRWDDWLALFSPQCEYWMPSWRTEEELTDDPQKEMSHIYYPSRAGLEDRIVRIRTRRSPASTPMPRTAHMIGYARLDDPDQAREDRFTMQTSWTCHVFHADSKKAPAFFGLAYYTFVNEDGAWRIGKKRTVLQNDYIPTMLDIYCI